MTSTTSRNLAALALACCAAASAQAASIIDDVASIAGPTRVITFNDYDGLLTTGPLELGATAGDIVFTSSPNTQVGANNQDLNQNGLWGARGNPVDGLESTPTGDGNFLASAFIARRGEFGFTFATGVSAVGAFFNQYQGLAGGNSMTLLAYDAEGNVLESFAYSVNTDPDGYNEGKFLGFTRASADIYGFGVTDGSFVMDNLTISAVPEPGSTAMLLAGLALMGGLARRTRRS